MPLIPFLTNSAPGAAIYAPASGGGGGGGGAGPTPSFSTITFPAAVPTPSGPTAGGILFSQQLLLDDLATNIAGDFAFTAAQPYVGVAGATSTTSIAIFAPQNESVLTIGAGQDSACYIDAAGPGGAAAIILNSVGGLYVSSFYASSINGVAPGGGGGVSGGIAVSSIASVVGQTPANQILMAPGANGNIIVSGFPGTFGQDIILDTGIPGNSISGVYQPGGIGNALVINDPGGGTNNINIGATQTGGAIIAAGRASLGGPSTLTITSDNVNFLQPIGGGAPLSIKASDVNLYDISVPSIATASIGTVGGRNQFYTNRGEIDDCMVSTITAVAGANITALKPLAVSSIIGVSTINGAAYPPPAGPTAQKLTWLNSGTNTLPSGGVPGTFVPLTNASAAVTNGHTYRVTANFGLSNTVATGITELVIEGAAIGGLPATIAAIPNIVTVDVPYGGYSGYFTVAGTSGGGVTVSGVNTGTANTTVVGDNAFVILEDLGVI